MFAIILATAETLHFHHVTDVQSAAAAAKALQPVAGRFSGTLFALGFIGSGLLEQTDDQYSVLVLTAKGLTLLKDDTSCPGLTLARQRPDRSANPR